MKTTVLYLTLAVAIYLSLKLEYNNAVIFKMTNAKCETFNKSWVLIYNCRLKAVRRHVTVLNINSTYLQPVNNLWVHAEMFKKANGYKPWLFNATVDACRFLRKPNNPIISLIFNLFKEFTNINHPCPFYGPQLVEGFYLKPELLRLPLPTGEYLLEITWIFDNRPQYFTNVYFEFVEDL
ncbi:uncharacterized protein LOC111519222 [Drosophila willistoni]|uniref:uncharacterized protein LOC111519222 n=1 Tax=Drosophila willistoni TaxID=7260 RepID=UPI001F071F81|nr:uncharacterized protein LOC111519222 [Drosophila willistoni]